MEDTTPVFTKEASGSSPGIAGTLEHAPQGVADRQSQSITQQEHNVHELPKDAIEAMSAPVTTNLQVASQSKKDVLPTEGDGRPAKGENSAQDEEHPTLVHCSDAQTERLIIELLGRRPEFPPPKQGLGLPFVTEKQPVNPLVAEGEGSGHSSATIKVWKRLGEFGSMPKDIKVSVVDIQDSQEIEKAEMIAC